MSIFNHGDICRYICGYLDLNDICMFRRCNRQLRTIISRKFFYERKTDYLLKLPLTPSEIMGITTDDGLRRYCKQKGWRATCPHYRFHSLTYLKDLQFVRYLLKTKSSKLSGGVFGHLMRTKDRHLIDLAILLCPQNHLHMMLSEILLTQDEPLIQWFEEKHLGNKLEQVVLDGRCCDGIWNRYHSQYRHCFEPSKDPTTGRYRSEDVTLSLPRGIFPQRVRKSHLNIDTYVEWCFRYYGYVEEEDYYVKHS